MKRVACVLGICLLWVGAVEAVVIGMNADTNNSSTAYHGSAVGNLLTDPFAYDPRDPTATTPALSYSGAAAYHGGEPDGSNVVVSFTLNSPFTLTSPGMEVVVDVWGRDNNKERDNDFDVMLCNGSYSTVIASNLHLAVPDGGTPYVRASFDSLGAGTTFDRLQIIGHDTSAGANAFTLMEVRLAELTPYTWTGTADGDWTNSLNWLNGAIPVDDNTNAAGLTMSVFDSVVFAGTSLPSTNVPGIGGTHDGSNSGKWSSPTMRFNSGGTGSFHVVADNTGFWSNIQADRTILTVGDGVGGGTEDVDVTLTAGTVMLNRHFGGITHNLLVNSDGTLRFSGNLDFTLNAASRWGSISLAGGSVIVNGTVIDLVNHTNNVVDFTASGSSFTAKYGGDFANIGAVWPRLGIDFLNNTGEDGSLKASQINTTTFTVTTDGFRYRWTGTAGDGDWSNTVNWVDGAVPVDTADGGGDQSGLTLFFGTVVEFDGPNLPTVNVPGVGGFHDSAGNKGWDTPSMEFNSGGTMDLAVIGREGDIWTNPNNMPRTVFTVGDGVHGANENVTLNLTMTDDLMRHYNGHHNYLVNSDGTFNITAGVELRFSYNGSAVRTSSFTIDGGAVVVNDPVRYLTNAVNYVEFTAEYGTFTAQYGGDFPDIATVESNLGTNFVDNTGLEKAIMRAIDGGTTFTVTVYEPKGMFLLVR